MVKKLTRGQKAWATRKANANKKSERKIIAAALSNDGVWNIGSGKDLLEAQKAINEMYSPTQTICSLSKALDNSLDRLEQRMVDYIARVDRILA